jgi:hypothetical protein
LERFLIDPYRTGRQCPREWIGTFCKKKVFPSTEYDNLI